MRQDYSGRTRTDSVPLVLPFFDGVSVEEPRLRRGVRPEFVKTSPARRQRDQTQRINFVQRIVRDERIQVRAVTEVGFVVRRSRNTTQFLEARLAQRVFVLATVLSRQWPLFKKHNSACH